PGEGGPTQEGGPHLFEHHREPDVAVARAAVLLGDDEALEAHLLAHLTPHGVVVALLGVHQAAHLGLGRLLVEEGPHGAAKLFLLLAEGEVHGIPPGTARLGTSGSAFLLDPRGKPDLQAKDEIPKTRLWRSSQCTTATTRSRSTSSSSGRTTTTCS